MIPTEEGVEHISCKFRTMQQVDVGRSTPVCLGKARVEDSVFDAESFGHIGIMVSEDSGHAVYEKDPSVYPPGM